MDSLRKAELEELASGLNLPRGSLKTVSDLRFKLAPLLRKELGLPCIVACDEGRDMVARMVARATAKCLRHGRAEGERMLALFEDSRDPRLDFTNRAEARAGLPDEEHAELVALSAWRKNYLPHRRGYPASVHNAMVAALGDTQGLAPTAGLTAAQVHAVFVAATDNPRRVGVAAERRVLVVHANHYIGKSDRRLANRAEGRALLDAARGGTLDAAVAALSPAELGDLLKLACKATSGRKAVKAARLAKAAVDEVAAEDRLEAAAEAKRKAKEEAPPKRRKRRRKGW